LTAVSMHSSQDMVPLKTVTLNVRLEKCLDSITDQMKIFESSDIRDICNQKLLMLPVSAGMS